MVDQSEKTELIQSVVAHPNRENLEKLLTLEIEEIKDNLLVATDPSDIRFYQGQAHTLKTYISRLTNTTS